MTRNMNRQAAPAPSAHDDHQCYWAVANIRDTLKLNDTCLSVLDLSPLFHTLGPVPNKSLSLSPSLSLLPPSVCEGRGTLDIVQRKDSL